MKKLSRKDMSEVKGGNWVLLGCQVHCVWDGSSPVYLGDFWTIVEDCETAPQFACWANGYRPAMQSCHCTNGTID